MKNVATEVWTDVASWPTFAQAARLLAIDRSTLSKLARTRYFIFVSSGPRCTERRISPVDVVRLAEDYRRVPLGNVKQELVRNAADTFLVEESELLSGLDNLVRARQTELSPPLKAPRPHVEEISQRRTSDVTGRMSTENRFAEDARVSREIDLGALQPRIVSREGFPSPEFVASLDRRTLRHVDFVVDRSARQEIDLGPLPPGRRS